MIVESENGNLVLKLSGYEFAVIMRGLEFAFWNKDYKDSKELLDLIKSLKGN